MNRGEDELRAMLGAVEKAATEVKDEGTLGMHAHVLSHLCDLLDEASKEPSNNMPRMLLKRGFVTPLARLQHVLAWLADNKMYNDPKQGTLYDVTLMMTIVYGAGPAEAKLSETGIRSIFAVRVPIHACPAPQPLIPPHDLAHRRQPVLTRAPRGRRSSSTTAGCSTRTCVR